ncbi:acetyl-CoA carboxylase biotin carboxyl carrier protein subunit [Halobacteriovorax marinus]|uniref:Biotin carboxyl carrier protein of acetyl-CoA carboxylase n=1 Tax=Halobacteriovorax marinus (strain ATCC BAA-682 / DSM 15412 / SJ) TaxID=862908 RepID=E1X2B7_HALMS|nr:acetyl-CoA carboxylase biotin carboxyl carrier protein [Halobacteriovorax marinus]ATH06507.1 acetyl-CoA carboxylase biotin carboxyl carrier protein subunit [Halobacteriovorax marinus]CBW25073.1 putative acetyl-CoA carboxylase biotin carboxyl carrier protein [Halobacteriovorax marinus SJ]
MDFKELEKFIAIAKEAGASELKYQSEDKKFGISFPVAGATPVAATVMAPQVQAAPAQVATQASSANSGLVDVTCPFVGTFYRSPSPEASVYVKVGDRVSKGQVLCIVEAMKIMNEIESDVDGEIVEICVENETYVEFGQVLFKVKP